ncbi:MAG: hypothetical protein EBU46_07670 [Nitrosomonadaceae bacterium]|nr:hypothetical protein [Nitrosomonadaceae bacterium]
MYAIALTIYLIAGLVWACYAGIKQQEYYPDSDDFQMFVALTTNLLIWPIAVVVAYFRYGLFKKPD